LTKPVIFSAASYEIDNLKRDHKEEKTKFDDLKEK